MAFSDWLLKQSDEDLQKIAVELQDELTQKVVTSLLPLMDKQAEYIIQQLSKKADEAVNLEAAPVEEAAPVPIVEVGAAPVTAAHDNGDTAISSDAINMNELKEAMIEAVVANQAPKIIELVKAIASSQGPKVAVEIIKAAKVILHDSVLGGKIEEEAAIEISQNLDALIGA